MSNADLDAFKGRLWAGLQQWVCPRCPYDGVDPGTFRRHLARHGIAKRTSALILPGDPGFDAPVPALSTETTTNGGE